MATATGTADFNWDWSGFHAFFMSNGVLQVFAETSSGTTVIDLVPFGNVSPTFSFTGSASIEVEEGMEFGIIVGGDNFDTNSRLRGRVRLSDFSVGAAVDFTGNYEPQNWADAGILGGGTGLDPASGPTETLAYSYDVDLGNPGPGVSFRTAELSHIAESSGTLRFDWNWSGFHSFFMSNGVLQVFAETSSGTTTVDLFPFGNISPSFDLSGSAVIDVEEGMRYGVIVGGDNFDSNSRLRGVVTITNFGIDATRDFGSSYLPGRWSQSGITGGTTDVGFDLSLPSGGGSFLYNVDLGNPGPGVSFRTAEFSVIAEASGEASFDWNWTGFHSFFNSNGVLQVFADTSTGRTVVDLYPLGSIAPSFNLSGAAMIDVEAGLPFGIIVGGDNFDSNSRLRGQVDLTNFDAPSCYADCTGEGVLDVFDFLCFQDAFVQNDPYADCDGNTIFDVFDFLCFQDAFVTGCP